MKIRQLQTCDCLFFQFFCLIQQNIKAMPNGVIDPKSRLGRGLNTARNLTTDEIFDIDRPFKHKNREFKRDCRIEAIVFKVLPKDKIFSCIADYNGTKVLVVGWNKVLKLKLRQNSLRQNRNEKRPYRCRDWNREKQYVLNCFDLIPIPASWLPLKQFKIIVYC